MDMRQKYVNRIIDHYGLSHFVNGGKIDYSNPDIKNILSDYACEDMIYSIENMKRTERELLNGETWPEEDYGSINAYLAAYAHVLITRAGLPQKTACEGIGLNPRRYRELRDSYRHDIEENANNVWNEHMEMAADDMRTVPDYAKKEIHKCNLLQAADMDKVFHVFVQSGEEDIIEMWFKLSQEERKELGCRTY